MHARATIVLHDTYNVAYMTHAYLLILLTLLMRCNTFVSKAQPQKASIQLIERLRSWQSHTHVSV